MHAHFTAPRRASLHWAVAVFVICLCSALIEQSAEAGPYTRFYGIVHLAPHNSIGTWVIGSRTIASDQFTEFYVFGGSLAIGSCASVVVHGDRAMKIDAEPMDRCQSATRPEGQLGTNNVLPGARL
jgi:hypothetical protein